MYQLKVEIDAGAQVRAKAVELIYISIFKRTSALRNPRPVAIVSSPIQTGRSIIISENFYRLLSVYLDFELNGLATPPDICDAPHFAT